MKPDGITNRDILIKETIPSLSFDEKDDFGRWREKLRDKFIELTGLDIIAQNACPIKTEIEKIEQKDGYTQTRFLFESERGSVVPCYLLVPDTGKDKYPVAITLQGHSTGFHNSIGEVKFPEDEKGQPRTAFAVQAVKNGYAALAIEQRGMGERAAANQPDRRVSLSERGSCYYEAVTGFLLGRTLIGERCWDISRAIDALASFPVCDTERIVITGNSGGGTASYYAAAYDPRIKVCAPSCSFCPYPESILRFYHCSCNYIPHAYRYFDMQDIAALIAPRKLIVVAGVKDPSFLIEGVRRGYETVKKIYDKAGAPNECRLIEADSGHWWNVDIMWPAINKAMENI